MSSEKTSMSAPVHAVVITDRNQRFIDEKFRRLQDRLDSARKANHADSYDILGRLLADAKALRQVLRKAKQS